MTMIARKNAGVTLVQAELALDAYLQALLAAVPDDGGELQAEASEAVEVVAATQQPELQSAIEVAAAEPEALPAPSAMPMAGDFYALFFRVGGITLATPVLDLRRIIDFDVDVPLTALPNQPSWLLGLVDSQGDTIGIMHTAELLLGREKIARRDFDARPYRKIIVSRHGRYGFACDEVLELVKLSPEDVRWRAESRQRRPWLMGVVSERLSALVDLAELTPIRR